MPGTEERVITLERTLERYIATAEETNRWLKNNVQRLDQNIQRLDAGLEEQKREARAHTLEMALIAERIGRFAEDIVAPNIPRLAREVFGIAHVNFSGQRVEKRHATDSRKFREFDFVLAGDGKLLVNETKSTARLKYFEEFANALKEIFNYFPEYSGHKVIPVFASLALSPDFVRRLTRLKIYALTLGERTMELLNLAEVAGRPNGSPR